MNLEPPRAIGRRRTATTLVELLGTLSVLLVLGMTAASLLSKVADIGTQSNQARQGRASIERLATEFRRDVQQASELQLPADHSIEITTPSQTIRYSWEEDPTIIRRSVTRAGKTPELDQFRLPADCQPSCQQTNGIVSLRLGNDNQMQPWIIEVKQP